MYSIWREIERKKMNAYHKIFYLLDLSENVTDPLILKPFKVLPSFCRILVWVTLWETISDLTSTNFAFRLAD